MRAVTDDRVPVVMAPEAGSVPLGGAHLFSTTALLDALWHWAPPIKCDPIHNGAVWVETSAIGTDFPATATVTQPA